jgi:hypothetical protein
VVLGVLKPVANWRSIKIVESRYYILHGRRLILPYQLEVYAQRTGLFVEASVIANLDKATATITGAQET